MKKLILTILFLSICTVVNSQDLKKGKWLDLTPCEELGNTNPICTGKSLIKDVPTNELIKVKESVKVEEVIKKNIAISVPVPKYIGEGKYCYPLPLGDNKYEWKCPENE